MRIHKIIIWTERTCQNIDTKTTLTMTTPVRTTIYTYLCLVLSTVLLVRVAEAGPLNQVNTDIFSTIAHRDNIALPAGASQGDVEKARLQIWSAAVESVLNERISTICKRFMRIVNPEDGPREACGVYNKHYKAFRYTCKADDKILLRNVVCGFDSIVVPTVGENSGKTTQTNSNHVVRPSPSSLSSSSPSPPTPRPPTLDKTTEPVSSASPSTTSTPPSVVKSSTTEEISTTSHQPVTVEPTTSRETSEDAFEKSSAPKIEQSSTLSNGPTSTTANPQAGTVTFSSRVSDINSDSPSKGTNEDTTIRDNQVVKTSQPKSNIKSSSVPVTSGKSDLTNRGSRQKTGLLTSDSRLSEDCNKLLPSVARFLSADHDVAGQRCAGFRLFVEGIVHMRADEESDFPGTDVLKVSCSTEERELVHEMLCSEKKRPQPTHAVQGQQQEHVRYVIKNGLTAPCQAALKPLGEGSMDEEAEESCRTLSGGEGDKLIANRVCTRHDMDYLIEAVCSSSRKNSFSPLLIAISVSLSAYLVRLFTTEGLR